jgi:hypothetical protein
MQAEPSNTIPKGWAMFCVECQVVWDLRSGQVCPVCASTLGSAPLSRWLDYGSATALYPTCPQE